MAFDDKITRRNALMQGAVGIGGLLILGCGGSDSDSGSSGGGGGASKSQLSEIDAAIDGARGVPKFVAPGPPVDGSKVEGMTVFYLSVFLSVPAQQFTWRGVREAATELGMKPQSFDAKGQTALAVQGIQQAIAQKVDVLLIDAVPSSTIAEPVRQALDAGIKVIVLNERNPETGGPKVDTGFGTVTFDFVGAAKLEADFVLSDSGGKDINCVTFAVPGDPAHEDMVKTIEAQFEKYAPGNFKLDKQWVLGADWNARLPVLTRSLLTSDPTINYMIPVVDAQSLYIVPALHQINKADQVKISAFNGTPAVMEMLAKSDVVACDIGSSFTWEGWADMDQAIRALTDAEPATKPMPPLRLFDETNIESIDLKAPNEGAEWYDTDAAIAGYKKLWGIA